MMVAAHGDENVTESSILISQDSGEPVDSLRESKAPTTVIGNGNPKNSPSSITSQRSQAGGRGESPRSVPSGVGGDADARVDAGADDGGGGGRHTAFAPDTSDAPDTPVSWAYGGGVTEEEVFMETPSRGAASHGSQPSFAGGPSVTDVVGGEQRPQGYEPLPTIPDFARREWTLTTTKPTRNTNTSTSTGTSTSTSISTRANAHVGGAAGGGLDRVAWGAGLMPPRWVPDDETTACAGCGKDFDWARRRHHCRACGRLYCYSCSRFRALLPRSFGTRDPQRLCQPCNARVAPLQEMLVGSVSNAVKENELSRGGLSSYLNKPISFTLGAEIRKAAYTVHNFTQEGVIQDRSIPQELLSRAKGLAFLTVIKGGFIVAGRVGTGLVIAKTEDGMWSAPSAIATVGVGWGALIGGEITDFVLVLNTDSAVEAFSGRGQVSIGAELGVAVGPVGRTGAGNVSVAAEGLAHAYSYSHSRGLFAGLSLEGGVIMARSDVNRKFYGRQVSVRDLLGGNVAPPPAARPLYEALEMRESGSENKKMLLLSQGFRLG